MESGRIFFASAPPFPSRNNVKNCVSASSSVPTVSNASTSSSSSSRHDDNRVCSQELKEYGVSNILERRKKNHSPSEDKEYQYAKEFFIHLLQPQETKQDEHCNVVALAKKALSASKKASLLCEDLKSYEVDEEVALSDDSSFPEFQQGKKVVRSTRLLKRSSNRQTDSKPTIFDSLNVNSMELRVLFDHKNGLKRFWWHQDTLQSLSLEEEYDLVNQIHNLIKLEEVKRRLHTKLNREPTFPEWAKATSLTSRELNTKLHSGNSSRVRLISVNIRMVVHIAKKYQGRGLNILDLVQEGSIGLLKSVDKFNPRAGSRFSSYAYWWIRDSIKKAIIHHSRMIRLPAHVYDILHKVAEAKRYLIGERKYHPTIEEVAAQSGIDVHKLESLLFVSRTPLSIQKAIWRDPVHTFQEIIPDNTVETPDSRVTNRLMRQHLHQLLANLGPRERMIIQLRCGLGKSEKPKSLQEIGDGLGLCKERVRQIESAAFHKLRQELSRQGLDAYAQFLVK